MKPSVKNALWGGSALFGLALTYYVATALVPKTLVTLTKAAPSQTVSMANSYVLGSKILARADGKDKCIVNVFVLDSTGKGIPGKPVELMGADGITAKSMVTDNDGKVVFEVVSSEEGQYPLTAMVAGVPLPRELKVTFRK